MDLNEFQARKKALEDELARTIQQAFSQFKAVTGVGILAIDVNIYRTYPVGDPAPDPLVGTVTLVVDL
ncbi:hypothetical protein [Pseudomonas massiliensis]|uniref:hypothetical protein n=1 Tax=Pseudomonas massiliensis TaxID=522492 RepID=UPI00058E6DCA|nr:hypothetical protein [Pseudomonas massiliensis]